MVALRPIYLDYNATSPVHPQVLEAMLPFFGDTYGNASSVHLVGRAARDHVDAARETIARILRAEPSEIIFTGSGSEGDNLAIKGVAEAYAAKGKHIITTQVEHPAVLGTCKYLEKHGYRVTYLPVDCQGMLDLAELEAAITPETILLSVMYANNETGTLFPVAEIGKIAARHGVLFHTDAVQAAGKVPIDVKAIGVHLVTLAGHKIQAPKGIGVLYVRRGTKIREIIHGGHQERGRRGGTENVPYIVGMARALQVATDTLPETVARVTRLRDSLWEGITSRIDRVYLNGHSMQRVCNTLNCAFEFVEGEALLIALDMEGICASYGSACTAGSLDPSHVLTALGLPKDLALSSIRMSMGPGTTEEEIDRVVAVLPPIIQRLRAMSPASQRAKEDARAAG